MRTLKNTKTQNKSESTIKRIFQSFLILAMLFIASDVFAQNKEVEFDVYTNSVTKASRYLMADDVALRDCPSVQCEQLTTIKIGTNVRLLAKSEKPQTINGVKSRWYKVKMGPQVGWLWGGFISQKTMVSTTNPEVKFMFGEAGFDYKGNKRFQIRAVKNGVELDKIVFPSKSLCYTAVDLINKMKMPGTDIISLTSNNESCDVVDGPLYIVFKNDKLQQKETLASIEQPLFNETGYVYYSQCEN
ncbi:hypothetical protein [uncultured Psychroserpens sp.]|uniref:hypothetical protein n=1 Tax=uncultured Psychroserpens sp. TaxID=255436 RepID=UPI0026264A18|nr:hypothetical protein [uncultured Psychroserpens sp.]